MKRECIEVCPHCEKEITKKWDVEKKGYQITCPNCGKKMMLCDECSKNNAADACLRLSAYISSEPICG